jgi:hypothetical protein
MVVGKIVGENFKREKYHMEWDCEICSDFCGGFSLAMEKLNRYRMVRPGDEGIPKMRGLVQGIAKGLGLEFPEQPSPSSSLMS